MTVNRSHLWIIGCGGFALGLAYLAFKVNQLAGVAGYDYKFIWVAGKIWLTGENPYDPIYVETATTLVSRGNIPDLWVYPPTWWWVASPFALLDLTASAVAWNVINVILIVITSLLLTDAYVRRTKRFDNRIFIFGLHVLVMAVFESTAIMLSVGQTSAFMLLGIALLIWADTNDVATKGNARWYAVLGLTLLFLKPQVGGIFAILWLMLGREPRIHLVQAVMLSAALCIPAMIVDPLVILDFLNNLRAYDSFTIANDPVSMTGIRIILYEVLNMDIGNVAATVLTLVAVLTATMVMQRGHFVRWDILMVSIAIILALAPLHTYDLVIAAPLVFAFARVDWVMRGLALMGGFLLLRSENWADLTSFHAADVDIFAGSRIATIGAIMLAIAVIGMMMHQRKDAIQ